MSKKDIYLVDVLADVRREMEEERLKNCYRARFKRC